MHEEENTRYAALKRKLLEVGMPIPGTIHALYARCGSPTCPCVTDNNKRHGPYYRWHYRLQGKALAHGIDETDIPQFQQGIQNRELIYRIIEEMMEMGVRRAISRIACQESSKKKSKKAGTRMRGK
jgi:hypothetical protein